MKLTSEINFIMNSKSIYFSILMFKIQKYKYLYLYDYKKFHH